MSEHETRRWNRHGANATRGETDTPDVQNAGVCPKLRRGLRGLRFVGISTPIPIPRDCFIILQCCVHYDLSMPGSSTFVCEITIAESLSVRLTVRQTHIEPPTWHWTSYTHNGQSIGSGTMPSRLAAQVAAQLAHQSWIMRRRVQRPLPPVTYKWEQVE